MSTLYYDITLEEEHQESGNADRVITKNLPHLYLLRKWLPKEWESCQIQKTFYGILSGNVESCPMTIFQQKDGSVVARIHIRFRPDIRLNRRMRVECAEQLDAQMADGFGESYDQRPIPGAEPGWVLRL